jgi:hypothetical protein
MRCRVSFFRVVSGLNRAPRAMLDLKPFNHSELLQGTRVIPSISDMLMSLEEVNQYFGNLLFVIDNKNLSLGDGPNPFVPLLTQIP